jgi:hypothetical protein
VSRYDESGQKTKYYADDDAVDLGTLVKRAKFGDDLDADLDGTVVRNIMRNERCVGIALGTSCTGKDMHLISHFHL